jgi:hypothetical protein
MGKGQPENSQGSPNPHGSQGIDPIRIIHSRTHKVSFQTRLAREGEIQTDRDGDGSTRMVMEFGLTSAIQTIRSTVSRQTTFEYKVEEGQSTATATPCLRVVE